jgi:outer membrane cobalamin receptor
MIGLFVATMLLAVAGIQLHVVDERGASIAGATVVFRSATDATSTETTDKAGQVMAPATLDAASVTVSAPGFETASVTLAAGTTSVVLRALGVIGNVSVATGSARNLHALAVPAAALGSVAIATSPAYTTDALLRSLPGFDFVRDNSSFTNYGNLRVSFSGAGEDRGLVLADDVPAQDGFGGQVDWLAYPPSSLASVELLRGPGAALYGANAIGGVLQLRSFSPSANWRALPNGRVEFQDGTPHRTNAALNYRFTLAPNVTASVATQTGHQAYYDLTPGYETPIDQEATASSTATRAQVRYAFGNSSLTAGGFFANDAQFEGRPNYSFNRDLTQTDLHFATSAGDTSVSVVGYNRDTTILNTSDAAPVDPGALRYVQIIPTRESGVAASWFLTPTYNEVAVRADEKFVYGSSTQTGPTGALQSSGMGKQQYAGLAIEDTYERGRFQLIGGLRGDVVTFFDGIMNQTDAPGRADRVLSPRIAARYDFTKAIAIRVSNGGGFREPFLNELLRGYQIGSVKYESNPKLTPERSAYYGVGADALLGRGRLSLDLADTQVHNAIEFLTISPTAQIRSNVARTQSDSTTLTYTTPVAHCTRLRAYLTSQYARITDGPVYDIGNRLQYVPSRAGDVAIDSGSGALEYGADVGYAGPTFADDRNTEVLPTAVIVGAHLTRPLGEGGHLDHRGCECQWCTLSFEHRPLRSAAEHRAARSFRTRPASAQCWQTGMPLACRVHTHAKAMKHDTSFRLSVWRISVTSNAAAQE